MAKEFVAEPDLQFTKDLIAAGGTDLKKCYQCATCSVACRIAPDNNPYPRKEMIWSQWGLRDKLMNDPDIWLCHQCNDCSTQCPRGANPGDVLKAIRKMVVQENSRPAFLGKLVGEKAMFVLAIGIPIILVALLLYISGWGFPSGRVTYSAHHLPPNKDGFIFTPALQIMFTGALIFALASLVMSLKAYWKSLNDNNPIPAGRQPKAFVPSLVEALSEILPHSTFKDCEANNIRYTSHLLAFWGMIGLAITTAIVAFNVDILGINPPSLNGPGTIPIKILGNVSAVAFVIGLVIMLMRRLTAASQAGGSSYFDWFFLYTILGTGFTGILTQFLRWSGSIDLTYMVYTVHLVFVMSLLLYLPFSKFAHIGYRTVAIAWSKSVGRNLKTAVQPNYVPPASAQTTAE